MSKSARLRATDMRAVARLSHECRDRGDDPTAWRTHLAAGLCGLVGGALGFVVEAGRAPDGSSTGSCCFWGWQNGFDRSAGNAILQQIAADPSYNPMVEPYLDRVARDDGLCLSRADLVEDGEWFPSGYHADHRAVGVEAMLICLRHLGNGLYSGIDLFRPPGEKDFTPRQKALVREANAVVSPLIGGALAAYTEPAPGDLPPRVRGVLRSLLEGDGDKQAAARLGLSRHTVNEYTKRIYRHFRVSGRAELLARWVGRGWGTRFAWDEPDWPGPALRVPPKG